MIRTFTSVIATIVAVSVIAEAAPTDRMMPKGKMLGQYDGYGWGHEGRGVCCGGDWSGHEGCEHHDCCCCHRKAPEITVHVIQPPPTFIYDVTHTACYTEHHDCCGCPYVCGPTCIPQGEVLAPANVGRKVAIAESGCKAKHHRHE
ncbi:hypothetical protein EV175_001826 [Coemansia sp. RSA 1933]|nr:hypothetical protein EV175_001826 [Coemansia sp. RSA 1933]